MGCLLRQGAWGSRVLVAFLAQYLVLTLPQQEKGSWAEQYQAPGPRCHAGPRHGCLGRGGVERNRQEMQRRGGEAQRQPGPCVHPTSGAGPSVRAPSSQCVRQVP